MKTRRLSQKELLFAACILLAGLLHALDSRLNAQLNGLAGSSGSALLAFASTCLFVLNLAVYTGLLIRWLQSVYTRLLPSRGRTYVIAAAVFMLLFLYIRSAKYRVSTNGSPLEHFCWYAYYVPLAAIPTLFLLTCLFMGPHAKRWLAAQTCVSTVGLFLVLAVVTNDWHCLMFRPESGAVMSDAWEHHTNGPLFYVYYVYICICIIAGLAILVRLRGRGSVQQALIPALLLPLTMLAFRLFDRWLPSLGLRAPWQFAETAVFCMLAIFEYCIRSRLIPGNEGYADFFAALRLPADITDPDLREVFRTTEPLPASADDPAKRKALATSLLLDEDTRLYGRRLPSGCAFWTGDEGTLRRLNEELADTAEVLESENDLLRLESEQQAERARVDARSQLYAKAGAQVYDTQKQVAQLLGDMGPEAPDFNEKLARVLLLNAYVKRKSNFVLLSDERDVITARELHLALEESCRFLALDGVSAAAEKRTDRDFQAAEAIALYDSFERVIEALAGKTASLLTVLDEEGLRLTAECEAPLELPETPCLQERTEEDGQLFIRLRAEKGGAR